MKALDMLRVDDMDKPTYHSINAPIMEFIVNRVRVECVGGKGVVCND